VLVQTLNHAQSTLGVTITEVIIDVGPMHTLIMHTVCGFHTWSLLIQ